MPNNWDLAPWLMDGGVKHSSATGRLLSFAAFQGQEGVLGSKDLQVTALASPGAAVRVWPGACAIHNKLNGAFADAYAARLPLIDQVAIASTGGTPRVDMIVARVEDPFLANSPWPRPSQAAIDNQTAEFVRTAVISGVAANATEVPANLGYSAIPLALVSMPANTSIVQQSFITDIRQLTKSYTDPPQENVTYQVTPQTLSSTTYVTWPSAAAFPVRVPKWATHMQATAVLGGVTHGPASSNLTARIVLDQTPLAGTVNVDLVAVQNVDRTTIMVGGGRIAVPSSYRGTEKQLRIEALKATNSANFVADGRTAISLGVTFSQGLESNV